MRLHSFYFLLILVLSCKTEVTVVDPDALFDGNSFRGWEGDKAFFRIDSQSIVAGSVKEFIPVNQFLCTENQFDNFHLSMDVKFVSRDNNAGIQYRSARIPNDHEVIGYQADVGFAGGENVWGSLYDESRRGRFLAKADQTALDSSLDPDGWNHYEVICSGDHIKHVINGTVVLNYEEEEPGVAKSGVICVQIHGGRPAEAWYRNIVLKSL